MGTFDLKNFNRVWVDRYNSQLVIEYYETKYVSKQTYRFPIERDRIEHLSEEEYQRNKHKGSK